ncbi:hypothetical protein D3C81_1432640 [compost metagenome]
MATWLASVMPMVIAPRPMAWRTVLSFLSFMLFPLARDAARPQASMRWLGYFGKTACSFAQSCGAESLEVLQSG